MSVFDVLRSYGQQALDEVEHYSENFVLSASTEDLMDALVKKYSFDFPELQDGDVYVEPLEVQRKQQSANYNVYFDDPAGTYRTVTQNIVIFHVPFTGDADMFKFGPSQRSIPGPAAEIFNSELLITVSTDNLTEEQIRLAFSGIVAEIKKNSWSNEARLDKRACSLRKRGSSLNRR